jgi:hypothetical protein
VLPTTKTNAFHTESADTQIAQCSFFTADDCFASSSLEYCESLPEWEQLALAMYPGDSIIGPMGPNAFAMHNLAPRRIRHFCTPDEFTTIVNLNPCIRIRKAYFFIFYEDHVNLAELSIENIAKPMVEIVRKAQTLTRRARVRSKVCISKVPRALPHKSCNNNLRTSKLENNCDKLGNGSFANEQNASASSHKYNASPVQLFLADLFCYIPNARSISLSRYVAILHACVVVCFLRQSSCTSITDGSLVT